MPTSVGWIPPRKWSLQISTSPSASVAGSMRVSITRSADTCSRPPAVCAICAPRGSKIAQAIALPLEMKGEPAARAAASPPSSTTMSSAFCTTSSRTGSVRFMAEPTTRSAAVAAPRERRDLALVSGFPVNAWLPASILGWAQRGRSQPPSVLAAVVDAGLVGDDDEINIGKVCAFKERARSDLEIDGIAVGAVDQMVAVDNARLEAGRVARPEHGLAFVLDQRQLAFNEKDELVLVLVPMAQRRESSGREHRQVDAELSETGFIAETLA